MCLVRKPHLYPLYRKFLPTYPGPPGLSHASIDHLLHHGSTSSTGILTVFDGGTDFKKKFVLFCDQTKLGILQSVKKRPQARAFQLLVLWLFYEANGITMKTTMMNCDK